MEPKKVSMQLNPPQMAALVLVEARIQTLDMEIGILVQLGQATLAEAAKSAREALVKAHGDYILAQTNRVQIASPADVPRLVVP